MALGVSVGEGVSVGSGVLVEVEVGDGGIALGVFVCAVKGVGETGMVVLVAM